jgi:transcription elongation factor Elf1
MYELIRKPARGKHWTPLTPFVYKKNTTLATNFACLFCNHENSVNVKIDRKAGAAILTCKTCGQTFQTGINCEFSPWPEDGE